MTAEELINNSLYITDDGEPNYVHDSVSSVKDIMISYTEDKIKEVVQAIKTNLKLTPYFYEQAEQYGILEGDTIDWNTIDEAVESIKIK